MRIVSLCPSLTELVFDLGAGDLLVGRTKFCVHPVDRVAAVESMGGTKNPKVARIVEVKPDLVLMNEEENRIEDAAALRDAGLRVHTSMPTTAGETAEMVRSIGEAIGKAPQSLIIARDIELRAARVARDNADLTPVSFAYLIWREPLLGVRDDTFVSQLLALANARNVLTGRDARYPSLNADELQNLSPDVVLLSSEPFPFSQKHIDELVATTGLSADRFMLVDGEMLSWHGSRTPRGIDYAEEVVANARARRFTAG